MEVFAIVNAGPDEAPSLQLNTVLLRNPVIFTNGLLLLMATLDSTKVPAERNTALAFRDWMACAMVLHGDVKLQEEESTPVEGFTVTETSALTPLRHAAQSKMTLKSDAATFG